MTSTTLKICPLCGEVHQSACNVQDLTNFDCWRQLYGKVREMQEQLDKVQDFQIQQLSREARRQLYGKVRGLQLEVDRLNETVCGLGMKSMGAEPVTKPPPSTELEQMQAELREWEKYYPSRSEKIAYVDRGVWYIHDLALEIVTENQCAIICAAILAAELERAEKVRYNVHCHVISNTIAWGWWFTDGKGDCIVQDQPTLRSALLALRQWEEAQ